ncbi:MAG: hypothetical protein COU06_00450 [Candidatus Harrisonbacteria bacterium CG10_big_fil_rev_8_21_14_0_10_38_8]|uniref:Polysaccharide biosynthesis protein C-terminal domain-containing protein n=1 Tax=Candidatus Harrisonbacteria bacterium CG10_big_fil_rev_8_21_14_0_10_38_8 TaxID=1974582 RepID=A0A2M6WKR6_9BACT|nr:MAG: hypothetical protein COU06_00450 [Candidatus Harrisonbacteria bacterium CG10_big_fil_rev_8_21_14_0_10_38_8]
MKNLFTLWLKKSEKYAKTDMVYLVGQSFWLFVGQGIIFLSSLILAWVFANYIDPSDYGLYKYVISIATLAALTSLTGFGVSIAKAVTKNYAVHLSRLLKIRFRFGYIGVGLLIIIAIGYYLRDNSLLATLILLAAIWVPFYEPFADYQFLLQGKKDFRLQACLRIFQRLILSVSVIAVILFFKNILVITFFYFGILTLSQYLAYRYSIYKYPTFDDKDTPYKEIISYGKHVSFQNIFLTGVNHIDKILMFKFLGPAQLAVYYFAIAIPNEIQGILGNINSVTFPKLVDKDTMEFKWALMKKILVFTLILAIPVVLYVLLAPFLFKFFFPVYLDSIFISQLYIGTILFIPIGLLWHYFYATENRKALWLGTVIGPTVFILGILVLVPFFGLVGAVFATYVRSIVDALMGIYFFFTKKK